MYSSLELWPTSTNPANFIPVIVEYYPFENYDYTIVYNEPPECCPNCKKYIDKHIIHEGKNNYKCNWCSKPFKSLNSTKIETQINDSSRYNHPLLKSCTGFKSLPLEYNFSQSMLACSMIYRELLGNHYFDHKPNKNRQMADNLNPSTSLPYCYTLFFVIDCCICQEKLDILKKYLLIALQSLKPDQSFILSVIHNDYISYVFVSESEQDDDNDVFSFNFAYGKENQQVFQLIDLRKPANFVSNLEPLRKFINSLKSDITETNDTLNDFTAVSRKTKKAAQIPKNPIDYFVQQLIGDDHLFSEIILFSTNGPKVEINKQIFIDWITTESNLKSKPLIDGYFICPDILNHEEQIQYMIQKISENPKIFNVEINAEVTNYRFIQNPNSTSHFTQFSPFSAVSAISMSSAQPLSPTSLISSTVSYVPKISTFYSTANRNFSVSYQLFASTRFTNAFNLFSPSYLGIEMTYVKFFHNNVFKETVWTTRIFKKSSDFIPTITTLNPFLLIPYLCDESAFKVQAMQTQKMSKMKRRSQTHSNIASQKNELTQTKSLAENFVISLINKYRYLCIVSMPGKFDDLTFSTIPELQWFLRIVFEHLIDYKDVKNLCHIKNIKDLTCGNINNENDNRSSASGIDFSLGDDDFDYFDSITMNIFENHKKFLFNSTLPVSCNLMEKFARFYPSVSFWIDDNDLLTDNCPLDLCYYESVGSPPIVLIDTIMVLFIFAEEFQLLNEKLIKYFKSLKKNSKVIDENSSLNVFISDKIEKRFPKTIISPQPLCKLYKLFPKKNELFACIKYYYVNYNNNNLLHKYD